MYNAYVLNEKNVFCVLYDFANFDFFLLGFIGRIPEINRSTTVMDLEVA